VIRANREVFTAVARARKAPATRAEGAFPPMMALYGDSALLAAEELARIRRTVLGPDADAMSIGEFDGRTAKLADVLDDARTPSLLGDRRMVVVREADPFVSAHRDALEKYLDAPGPGCVLVLVVTTWPAGTRLYRQVEALGGNVSCGTPKGRVAITSWIVERARDRHGCVITPGAAEKLFALVGPDLGLLDGELGKLALYVLPRNRVEPGHVSLLVGMQREEQVFIVWNAVLDGDLPRALAQWNQVREVDRNAVYWALPGLAARLRSWVDARRLIDLDAPSAAIREGLGHYSRPEVEVPFLRRFPLRWWEDRLLDLLKADLASKSGGGDVETAVEKLIVRACNAA